MRLKISMLIAQGKVWIYRHGTLLGWRLVMPRDVTSKNYSFSETFSETFSSEFF